MNAEFQVTEVTMVADGSTKLRLQPVGEPGFHLLELHEGEEGVLGDVSIELGQETTKYLPRPGDTVRVDGDEVLINGKPASARH